MVSTGPGNDGDWRVPKDSGVGTMNVPIRILRDVFMASFAGSNQIVGLIIRTVFVDTVTSAIGRTAGFLIAIQPFTISRRRMEFYTPRKLE